MLNKKSTKIILFLVIPVIIAGISFFYNFAGYLFSAGPLTMGHKEFDNSCFKCHMPLVSVSTSCLSCHKAIKKSLDNEEGFHGNMSKDKVNKCLSCHIDHKGANHFIVKDSRKDDEYKEDLDKIWKKNKLFPEATYETVNPQYKKLWSDMDKPMAWDERKKAIQKDFEHKLTGYPLIGGHAKVKCEDCHKNVKKFAVSQKEGLMPSFSMEKILGKDFCYSCHKKDDDAKKGHHGKYGKDCASCHTIGGTGKGWKTLLAKIDGHHKKPKHELKGRHKKVKCQRCHKTVPFKKKPEESTCIHCHEKLDKKYHEQSLGKKCENCHTPASFHKPIFDHQKTKFPLKDGHRKVRCQKCHLRWNEKKKQKKIYDPLKNVTCFYCHAKDDVHHGSFQKDCSSCHKETFWGDVTGR